MSNSDRTVDWQRKWGLYRWRLRWFFVVLLPHTTFQKLANLVLFQWDYLRRNLVSRGRPYYAVIDTNNICNLKCPLCPTGLMQQGRRLGQMDLDTFKKVFDQMSKNLFIIQMHNWGEPFLNPAIFDMITHARGRNVATMISANFNIISDKNISRIVSSGLTHLVVSIDGASQETYERYRVKGDLEAVLENVRKLVREREVQGSKFPLIQWQFIVMRHNEHEIEKAKLIGKNLGIDGVTFYTRVKPQQVLLGAFAEGGISDAVSNNFESWRPVENPEYRIEYEADPVDKACPFLWKSTVVNWDGTVAPCTVPDTKLGDFGNLRDNSFDEIWNGETYRAARGLFRKDLKGDQPYRICQDCTFYVHPLNPALLTSNSRKL